MTYVVALAHGHALGSLTAMMCVLSHCQPMMC
nr:MAG TPA: hypothetical protein [Caudoviricetes sp.]